MPSKPLATLSTGETEINPDTDEDAEWESILRVRVEHCGRVQDVVLDEPRHLETWTTVRQKIREAFALQESIEFDLFRSIQETPFSDNTPRILIDSLHLLRESLLAVSQQPASPLSLFLATERHCTFPTNAPAHKNTQTRLPRVFSDPVLLHKEDIVTISDEDDPTNSNEPFKAPNAHLEFGGLNAHLDTPIFETPRSLSFVVVSGNDSKTRGRGEGGVYSGRLFNAADVFRAQQVDVESATSAIGYVGEWMAAIAIVVFAWWIAQ